MEILYGLLMSGVAFMILAGLVEAVHAVSKEPVWQSVRFPVVVTAVVTEDCRTQQLPFVGVDRRESATSEVSVRKAA